MLSLDSLKTRTIYSKHQIDSLHLEFKDKLNQAYAQETDENIQNVLMIIKLLHFLSDVPSFPKEFNEKGQIQLLALLEILFMKSSHWKKYKESVQSWVSTLMKKVVKFVPSFQIKPLIAVVQFDPQKQINAIKFFAQYLDKVIRWRSNESMIASISFLRVYLIDQLQNKKKQMQLVQNNVILLEWKSLNDSLIKICNELQNLKNQQICVSICYWLCSQNHSFISECIMKGLVTFLCQTLSNKNISEWYGRKILSFLKLLLLGLNNNSQYLATTDIQSCIAIFTLKYDNQTIMQQAKNLLSCIKNAEGKVQKQIQHYDKYTFEKNPKNLQQVIKSSRVLLLYSEDEIIRKELSEPNNLEYLLKLIKKQENLGLLNEIFNIVAYNSGNKSKNSAQDVHGIAVVQRVSDILSSSKDKQQLVSNNKKILITLIRMLKQLIQSQRSSQKFIEKFKSESIIKKLGKFSDCTNFQYERELLSLMRIFNATGQQPKSPNKKPEIKTNQSSDIMKALVKHMNEKIRKAGRKLQDQLQQIQLLYEMLQRGQAPIHKQQTIAAIFEKIKLKRTQTEEVQITILDRSQEQRNRQLINKINYFAIASLDKLQNQHYQQTKYSLKNEDVQKLVNIGVTTQDVDILKVDTSYLIALANHDKLIEEFKLSLNQIYRRYKEKVGEDSQLVYRGNKAQQPQINQSIRIKSIQQIFTESLQKDLQLQDLKILQNALLNEESISVLKQWIQRCENLKQMPPQSFRTLFLKFILKLSQIEELKQIVFKTFSKLLAQNILKCKENEQNLIFKIYSELYEQNIRNNKQFFQTQLIKSYQFLTKESLQFTHNCLSQLDYTGSANRQEQYWKYIYNSPQMIGRQAVYLIRQPQTQKIDKFWSFFAKPIEQNIKVEQKMTLHFLEKVPQHINNETWQKFQLVNLLQQLMSTTNERTQQIQNKIVTQVLLRKLLRPLKAIKSIVAKEDLDISTHVSKLYDNIGLYIQNHRKIDSQNKKLHILNEEYLKILVSILKHIYRNREMFNIIKKELKGYEQICQKVSQYDYNYLNDELLEIYRMLFLRDDKHEQFTNIQRMFESSKSQLLHCCTDKGKQNAEACQKIIEAVKKKNELKFRKQYLQYFFPGQAAKMSKKEAIQFSDEELLKHLKNLLNPPYQFGLNYLQKKLKLIQNADFANTLVQIFINSQRLYNQDKEYQQKPLQQVQKTIVDCIWGHGCQINSDFYKMINMNLIGLRVCLKTKGIGAQGTTIVCEKFYQYPQQIPLCSQILYINVASNKQWGIILDKKIPELVNITYKNNGKDPIYGRSLANLIGSSSKLKSIQTQYKLQIQLFQNLEIYSKNIPCLASTLYALSGLVYLNDVNQKISGSKQCIKQYIKIIQENSTNHLIFDKGCNLLSNLIYKNTNLVSTYLQLTVEITVIKIATTLLYQYGSYKQFLRLIGNLSLALQAANSIVKTQFLHLWSNILKEGENNKHQDIIKYSFDIIFNLLNYHEVDAKPIAYKVYEAGCSVKIIEYLQRNCLVSSIVQSGLDALEKSYIIQASRQQALENGVLRCLQDIAKTQSWNENVLQKWITVLFILIKENPSINTNILKTQVFSRLAMFIKQHPQIKLQYLNLLIMIQDLVYQKGDHKLFAPSGFVDFLAQLLKIKHLKAVNAATIIDSFCTLHGENVLGASSYTKIFSGLMARLQIEFRDENSKKIISAITKIRDRIAINTRAATILLQFGYMFLTQTQIITSQKYQKRVRQFICLLSYFISFSVELKIIFREEGFTEILQSWIKIDKSLDEDNSVSEACRVCIFTIQNQQRFLQAIPQYVKDSEPYFQKFPPSTKCLLYRRNHTNKNAIIKLRKQDSRYELVAFKAPDGQIKQKYIVPLDEIIGIRAYQSTDDQIYKDSVFSTPGGLFQKSSVAQNCLTIIAIVGEKLSIRQLDIQFPTKEIRDELADSFKFLVSLEYRSNKTYG